MATPEFQAPFPAVERSISGDIPSFSPAVLVGTALSTLDNGMLAHCPVHDSTVDGSPVPCYVLLPMKVAVGPGR
ncbi:MAG: hypothetical protein LKM36_04295 [Flavobacteriales bacterium]|nr:hypothetical protein [Flavobacteriales bacterium]MBP9159841.1 hypothetical protein [Flavobacteriales bacterium]MCI1752101.1 hypothetical protein [Flavobacteriales bacterium]